MCAGLVCACVKRARSAIQRVHTSLNREQSIAIFATIFMYTQFAICVYGRFVFVVFVLLFEFRMAPASVASASPHLALGSSRLPCATVACAPFHHLSYLTLASCLSVVVDDTWKRSARVGRARVAARARSPPRHPRTDRMRAHTHTASLLRTFLAC
jgi:hypothetical protein